MDNFTEKIILNQQVTCPDGRGQHEPFVAVVTPDFASVTVFDTRSLPDRDNDPVTLYLTEVAITIANAGYEGIDIVESCLPDGRIFSAVSVKPDTPEGLALEYVQAAADAGALIPIEVVLGAIRDAYLKRGRS
jgi:hypothetical protein